MKYIDDILEQIWSVHGKAPDELKLLERQALAAFVTLWAGRGSPSLLQRAINNPLTRWAASYATRHPFATIAAVVWNNYKQYSYRQYSWTTGFQTSDVALDTLIFSQGGSAFRWLLRQGKYALNPAVVENVGSFLGNFHRFQIWRKALKYFPKQGFRTFLSGQWLVKNRFTVGAANYLYRHPVASLLGYLSASWVDSIYRPPLAESWWTPGLTVPFTLAYAHTPELAPKVIRGFGRGVNSTSQGLAYVLEQINLGRQVGAEIAAAGTEAAQATRPAVAGTGLVAKYTQLLTRGRAGAGAGMPAVGYLTGLGNLPAAQAAVQASPTSLNEGRVALAQFLSLRKGFSISNWRIAYPAFWKSLLDYRFFPAWARTAGFITAVSWYTTFALKGYFFYLKPFIFGSFLPEVVTSSLGTATFAGFISPFFTEGTIGGAAKIYANWVVNGWHEAKEFGIASWNLRRTFRNVFSPLKAYLPVITRAEWGVILGTRQISQGIAETAAQIRAVGRGLSVSQRFLARYAARPLAIAGRVFGGPEVLWADFVSLALEEGARATDIALEEDLALMRIEQELNNLQRAEDFGIYTGLPAAEVGRRIRYNRYQANVAGRGRDPYGDIDYLRSLRATFHEPRLFPALVETINNTLLASSTVLTGTANYLDRLSDPVAADRPPWWALPPDRRGRSPNAPRGANGRYLRNPTPAPPPPVLPPVSHDEALNYINYIADLFARARAQGATKGQATSTGGAQATEKHGTGRNFWLYRARDRRLMLQTLRNLQAIVARDKFVTTGKKTQKISTREQILPPAEGWLSAVLPLIEQLKYDASLVRNRGSGGGYYSLAAQS